MAVDTPAKISILGAGPIGLEAALYARFLGYDVVIYERGRVAEHVQQWGHVRMFSPFGMNRSPLGMAALMAQHEEFVLPADDALLTGAEFMRSYLQPLAESDLLADSLRIGHEVLAIGRENFLKGEMPGAEERGEFDFRLLVRDSSGTEMIDNADVVIDATGVFSQPNWVGCSGIRAVGEREARGRIDYGLPDILGSERARFAGKHTLLVGGGHSAATNAVSLAELAAVTPGTQVTWITRREPTGGRSGPIEVNEQDPLPARRQVAQAANALCGSPGALVTYWPLTDVERIKDGGDRFEIELSGTHEGTHTFDNVIANVGFRPDNRLYEELQVQECFASGAPLPIGSDVADRRSPSSLLNPEPNFYVLGAKSFGRDSSFLLSDGLKQVVDVFKIIGDRETLDLYANARLPR